MTNYDVVHEATPETLAVLLTQLVAGCIGVEPGSELYLLTLKKIRKFLSAKAEL